MQLTDKKWLENWSLPKFPKSCPEYNPNLQYGSDEEPASSLWLASLCSSMGDHFKENMIILDYGCGAARCFNFISSQLKDFTYYGLEPSGSCEQWGEKSIDLCIRNFGHDPRSKFGFIDSPLETEAIEKANIVVLGSIFTHLPIEHSTAICDKLLPIPHRNGCIVFSIILGDYKITLPEQYGFKDCYYVVHNTKEQFDSYCYNNKLKIEPIETFDAGFLHTIFRVTAT
jgi:hypothetical protein